MTTKLPKFDWNNLCPKCGSVGGAAGGVATYLPDDRAMKRRCRVCGAEWLEAPLDAEEEPRTKDPEKRELRHGICRHCWAVISGVREAVPCAKCGRGVETRSTLDVVVRELIGVIRSLTRNAEDAEEEPLADEPAEDAQPADPYPTPWSIRIESASLPDVIDANGKMALGLVEGPPYPRAHRIVSAVNAMAEVLKIADAALHCGPRDDAWHRDVLGEIRQIVSVNQENPSD